ncbi:MAG: IS4 family transposase, partial [Gammaproteobacteria bacterium]|nr:IS4 family transposase [Gammaproteobacteria bacterium]MBQ0839998.1 IS4 family transposase [Gammaproteobacteria bacterium]
WCQQRSGDADVSTALLFTMMAQRKIGNRPDRIEPRAVKRRPKPMPLLMKSREEARAEIRKNGHSLKLK